MSTRFFSLEQAEAVAPLVESVVRSMAVAGNRLAELKSRDDLLFECRHSADYRVRSQYYRHCEETAKLEREIADLDEELRDTGAELIERTPVVVGVPFKFNSKKAEGGRRKKAYFLIGAEQETGTIQNFRVAGEHKNRAIPTHWRHQRKQQRSAVR